MCNITLYYETKKFYCRMQGKQTKPSNDWNGVEEENHAQVCLIDKLSTEFLDAFNVSVCSISSR